MALRLGCILSSSRLVLRCKAAGRAELEHRRVADNADCIRPEVGVESFEFCLGKLPWTSFYVACLENEDQLQRFDTRTTFRIVAQDRSARRLDTAQDRDT